MLKSNRVTLLIICFSAIAAILNELHPSEILEMIKTYLVINQGSEFGVSTMSKELGMVGTYDFTTFILLSTSIIGGLFIIAYLKLARSGKIISTQSVRLARQEEELQLARQVLAVERQNEGETQALYGNGLSILNPPRQAQF